MKKLLRILFTSMMLTCCISITSNAASKCAEPGCTKDSYCGSYCAAHDHCKIIGACKTRNYGGRQICKDSRCGNTATSYGYCERHSDQYMSKQPSARKCPASGCKKTALEGRTYCSSHSCYVTTCNSIKSDGSYCASHVPYKASTKSRSYSTKTTTGSKTTIGSKTTASSKLKDDPYDVHWYDDPDDFAADQGKEFDDYDVAWDYWQDNHKKK